MSAVVGVEGKALKVLWNRDTAAPQTLLAPTVDSVGGQLATGNNSSSSDSGSDITDNSIDASNNDGDTHFDNENNHNDSSTTNINSKIKNKNRNNGNEEAGSTAVGIDPPEPTLGGGKSNYGGDGSDGEDGGGGRKHRLLIERGEGAERGARVGGGGGAAREGGVRGEKGPGRRRFSGEEGEPSGRHRRRKTSEDSAGGGGAAFGPGPDHSAGLGGGVGARGQEQLTEEEAEGAEQLEARVHERRPSKVAELLAESAVELDASVSAKTESASPPEVEAEVQAGTGAGVGTEAGAGAGGGGDMRGSIRDCPAEVVPGLAVVPEGQRSGALPYDVYAGLVMPSKLGCMLMLTLQVGWWLAVLG